MLWRLVLAGLFATSAQAFAPTAIRIQWGSRSFALAPQLSPGKSAASNRHPIPPRTLMLAAGLGTTSPDAAPQFTLRSDGAISWDGFCWEASGDKIGDAIHVNHCAGRKSQLWNLLPERNQIQLQGTKMCAGINEEGGLSGGTADLRECDHDRTSESWKFTAVARSIEHPYGEDAQLSSMRLGVAASLWMIGLGALSLSVWLWRWQSGARVTAMRQHRLPLDVAQGGVSLCAPFIACEGNAMLTPRFDTSAQVEVPAVMTTSPEPIGEGINMVSDEELEALCKALSEEVHEEPVELDPAKVEKAMKGMVAFSNTYAKRSGTKFCSQREIPAAVIRGLAENKVRLGAPLCPCRSYDDEKAEVKNGAMNCPCEPMRTNNDCHCMLFLKEDDEFAAGDTQKLTLDEVKELAAVS